MTLKYFVANWLLKKAKVSCHKLFSESLERWIFQNCGIFKCDKALVLGCLSWINGMEYVQVLPNEKSCASQPGAWLNNFKPHKSN